MKARLGSKVRALAYLALVMFLLGNPLAAEAALDSPEMTITTYYIAPGKTTDYFEGHLIAFPYSTTTLSIDCASGTISTVSHGDRDHCGGYWNHDNVYIGQVLYNDEAHGVKVTVVAANGHAIDGGSWSCSDENCRSMALWVRYKGFDFLTAGDMYGNGESHLCEWLNRQTDINIDVFKLSHHGTTTNGSNSFVGCFSPEITVACGTASSLAGGATYYAPAIGTDVVIRTNGRTYTVTAGGTTTDPFPVDDFPTATPTPSVTPTPEGFKTPSPTPTPYPAALPFYDGFETVVLGRHWSISTTNEGRVRFSPDYPYAGTYSALLDDGTDGSLYSTAALILTADLSDYHSSKVSLEFQWREFNDENHAQDGVFISDDYGGSWNRILSFNNGPQSYTRGEVILSELRSTYGLDFNDHFQVKFQFYGNAPIPTDGYSIDEVRLWAITPTPSVTPTPEGYKTPTVTPTPEGYKTPSPTPTITPTPSVTPTPAPLPTAPPCERIAIREMELAGCAEVTAAACDIGSKDNLFDGNWGNLYRTDAYNNPAVITVEFDKAQATGAARGQFTNTNEHDWTLEAADSIADLESKSGTYVKIFGPVRVYGGDIQEEIWEETPVIRKVYRFSVYRVFGDNHVHITELELRAPCALIPTPTPTPEPTVPPTPAPTCTLVPTPPPTPAPTTTPVPTPPPTPAPTCTLVPTPPPTPAPTCTLVPTPPPTSTPVPEPTATPDPGSTPPCLVVDWDDYDGDGTSDLAVYRPGTGEWSIDGITSGVVWGGGEGDIPVPGDYDGDGAAELAYFNRFNGRWNVMKVSGEVVAAGVQWGKWGDLPAPGDYDGDGTADLATWRFSDGYWRIRGVTSCWYGQETGMYPVPGDYDGDGSTDIALVWSGSEGGNNTWYLKDIAIVRWMLDNDIAVPMDYDGDGTTDLAVYRPDRGCWYIRHAGGPVIYAKAWGVPAWGDLPVVGDFDGDGAADLTVLRQRKGKTWWWVSYSSRPLGYSNFPAQAEDIVVTGAPAY